MTFFSSLINFDLLTFNNTISVENVNSVDSYGNYPIDILWSNLNEDISVNTAIIMFQKIINNSGDSSKIIEENNEDVLVGIKLRIYQHLKNTTSYHKRNAGNNHSSRPVNAISAHGAVTSCYTGQEKLKLEKMAKEYGIPIRGTHLSLRIINYLKTQRICPKCNTSI